MRLVKSVTFDAAHYLGPGPRPGGRMNDGVNDRTIEGAREGGAREGASGIAQSPYARLHGHSFLLEVELRGEPDAAHGWVVDFAELSASLDEVKTHLDHRLLNEVEGLEQPTLENICLFVAALLHPGYPGLARVSVSRPSNGETCHYRL